MSSVGRGLHFIDIGANLIDSMYKGIYNQKTKHQPDLQHVLLRSWDNGLKNIITTGTSLEDSKAAIDISNTDDRLFATVGCHPTNCNEIENFIDIETYYENLKQLCVDNKQKVVALGEFGLDYDRINFCPADVQKKHFVGQLKAFEQLKLPLFLHCRNAANDLHDVLSRYRDCWTNGVVHSFDGSYEEACKFLDLGLFIGLNGCSLKTEDNISVVKMLPTDKILLETDSPWCQVRPSHASYKFIKTHFPSVKKEKWQPEKMIQGRNEPSNITQILEILSGIRDENIDNLADTIFNNTKKLFFTNF